MAAENVTLTTAEEVLEELYQTDDMIEDIMRSNPMLGMVKHSTEGGGQHRHVVVKHTRPQGRSNTFSNAQSNRRGTKRAAFDVTWVSGYQLGGVDGDVIDDAGGNAVILIDHLKAEMDGCFENIKDDLGFNVFRNYGGARGQCSNDPTDLNGTVTLTNAEDITHFEVGMVLTASTDDGTGAGTDRAGTGEVATIDREAGSFTYTGTITGITTNDYLFVQGDHGAKMHGLDSWCPSSTPTSTPFFGVDRSVEPERLGGVRYDAATPSDTTREALVNQAVRFRRWNKGLKPDIACVSPLVYGALDIAMESDKRVVELKSPNGSIGYEAIRLSTPAGSVDVFEDASCQSDTSWMMDSNSFCFETVGPMIRILDEDGNKILRESANDGYEFRIKTRGNFWSNRPSAISRATLS